MVFPFMMNGEALIRSVRGGKLNTVSNVNRLTENTSRELFDKSEYLSNPS